MVYLLVASILRLFLLAVFVRVILSWVVRDYRNPLYRLLIDITEPVLGPIRRAIPVPGGIDFSPMIAMVVIYLLLSLLPGGGSGLF
ncbi:MAG: YggT family protein [Candidatus Dormibacteria bacterium]